MTSPDNPRPLLRPRSLLLPLFLASLAASFLLWSPVLPTTLLFDDCNLVYFGSTRRPAILADFVPLPNGYWRPFPLLSARLVHAIAGLQPLGYHAASLLLHALVVTATARLGGKLGLTRSGSLAAALLLAVHAGAYSAVAQFQNIGDLFLGLFAVLTMTALVGLNMDGHGRTRTDTDEHGPTRTNTDQAGQAESEAAEWGQAGTQKGEPAQPESGPPGQDEQGAPPQPLPPGSPEPLQAGPCPSVSVRVGPCQSVFVRVSVCRCPSVSQSLAPILFALGALASKETALALLGVCAVWVPVLAQGAPRAFLRRTWVVWAGLVLLFVGFAVWSLMRVESSQVSSLNDGSVAWGKHVWRKLPDYLFGCLLPVLHATPIDDPAALPPPFKWAIRALVVVVVTVTLWLLGRKGRRTEFALLSSAAILAVIPSLMGGPFHPRFIYPMLPFWSLFAAHLLWTSLASRRAILLTALLALPNLPLFGWNLRLAELRYFSRHMETLTAELQLWKPTIPQAAAVCILHHPYGSKAGLWPFGQFWLWVYFPEKHWHFATQHALPKLRPTDAAFRWTGTRLVPIRKHRHRFPSP